MLEQAARRAEQKERISTRFGEISDLLREAGYWAGRRGNTQISAQDVQHAVEERVYRSSLIKDKIVELIEDGTLLIDTDATAVGQVNGLSVMQLGDFSFGRPNRITATAAVGRDDVLDIEREAKLGGPIHNKGVLILTGFLDVCTVRGLNGSQGVVIRAGNVQKLMLREDVADAVAEALTSFREVLREAGEHVAGGATQGTSATLGTGEDD